MAFTLPDKGEGLHDTQSVVFQEYIDVLVAGISGTDAVISGCAVTPSSGMTLAVASGLVRSNSTRLVVGTANPVISAAHATLPRLDLVVVTSAGAVAVRTGTAAAAPVPPARTANDVVLAVVYVPANDTTIDANQIVDMRTINDAARNISTQTIAIPAGAMKPRLTNGAAAATVALGTNGTLIVSLDFDPATVEYAQFAIPMPKGWNASSVLKAVFEWSHAATATNFGVAWDIKAKAVSDGDLIDGAWGTAVQVNDVGGTTDTLYKTAISGDITPAGSPATGDTLYFEISRVATDATNDTLAIDARFARLTLLYITTSLNDA